MTSLPKHPNPPAWHEVEKQIYKEIAWLDDNIVAADVNRPANLPITDKKYLLRHIALLIVSGSVRAREIKSTNLWPTDKGGEVLTKPHGQDWHFKTMQIVASYFKTDGYEVIQEPYLSFGTADLGVFKDHERPLFVEVGSISSFYKLLYNLSSMEGSDILIIPRDNYLIEFEILSKATPI